VYLYGAERAAILSVSRRTLVKCRATPWSTNSRTELLYHYSPI